MVVLLLLLEFHSMRKRFLSRIHILLWLLGTLMGFVFCECSQENVRDYVIAWLVATLGGYFIYVFSGV